MELDARTRAVAIRALGEPLEYWWDEPVDVGWWFAGQANHCVRSNGRAALLDEGDQASAQQHRPPGPSPDLLVTEDTNATLCRVRRPKAGSSETPGDHAQAPDRSPPRLRGSMHSLALRACPASGRPSEGGPSCIRQRQSSARRRERDSCAVERSRSTTGRSDSWPSSLSETTTPNRRCMPRSAPIAARTLVPAPSATTTENS